MHISMPCIVPRGYLRGPPSTKKSVFEGSFIKTKSVKEELILPLYLTLWAQRIAHSGFYMDMIWTKSGSVGHKKPPKLKSILHKQSDLTKSIQDWMI